MEKGCFLNWKPMTSCMPQGSVLSLLMFVVYANDLDDNVRSIISEFSCDTKINGIGMVGWDHS